LLEDVATTNATATTRDARGAGARTTLDGLRALDAAWAKMRRGDATATATATAAFAKRREGASDARGETYDVAVAGGTLGVLVAAALQRRGARVVVVERGELRGREQEWNVSREELERLVRVGAITTEDADACTRIEFNPIRCGFHGGGNGNGNAGDLVTRDILNTGVSPAALVEACRKRFEEAGGAVLERASLRGVEVYDDCAVLDVDGAPVRARLVLDCMGFQSPIVRQSETIENRTACASSSEVAPRRTRSTTRRRI